ncbi:DUF536 domain-containing protein (plasmid) [Oenococcus alcoholitolerans]|uniref:Replication protein RepB n=1 Tax=Oenococcus alcoholitolerans TaxID=931074 RepID=A0ABR4XTB3_9LACO|nr:replication protein RepB [Oenococcus alcoholitolerans]
MTKTIKELAEELKVSKQTIQYHYQRLPAKNRQKDDHGINVINAVAERLIKSKVTKPLLAKKQQIPSKEATNTNKDQHNLVVILTAELDDLKNQRDKQLASKDQQISNKDRQIDHLTKLIDQQQQLQLATVNENRELKEKVESLNKFIESSNSTQKRQAAKKDNSLSNDVNSSHIKDKNDKQDKGGVVDDDKQKRIHKSKTNNSWWHFW